MKTILTKPVPAMLFGFLAAILIAIPGSQAQAQASFTFNGFLTFTDGNGNYHTVTMDDIVNQGQDVPFPCFDWQGEDDQNQGPEFHLSCSATMVGTLADVNFNQDHNQSHPFMQSVADCATQDSAPFSGQLPFNDGDTVMIVDFLIDRNPGGVCDPTDFDFPSIEVTKTGPDMVKVGDEFFYEISFENTGNLDVENCTGDDPLLGGDLGAFEPGVARTFPYTPTGTDDNPLENTVTITCDVVDGAFSTVSDSDNHTVDLIAPDMEVSKDGPASAKVGDVITYTIGFTNTGTGDLENCTGNDDVLGDLGDFEAGVDRTFDYTVSADDDNPLENMATITCDVVGFDNQASDYATHSLDWVDPDVSLTKECYPDPVIVGDEITWAITVENTGTGDLECELSDPDADINESFSLAPAASESFNASRMATLDDLPFISNTASVECGVVGYENQVADQDSAECVVEVPGEEICRTPGFWGTHAGEEHRRSTDLVQLVIDAGGPLSVCGQTIDNTEVGNVHSAVEAMCVQVEGVQQRQLARQLTAMSLNCIVSGGQSDCTATSVDGLFASANAACEANADDLGEYIARVDCFNNGGQFDEGTYECHIDDESQSNCQNRDLDESTEIFDGVRPLPGPAGSPRACNAASGNGIKVVPAS